MTMRIFISSVQRELGEERRAIRDFVQGDALLRRFFSVFLFEDLPGQVTGQVTGQVEGWIVKALTACLTGPQRSQDIQDATGSRHRETFQRNYLDLLLSQRLIERTIPEKPTSRLQKYRITDKGRAFLEGTLRGDGL